jgi:hypothetical protein
MTDDHYSQQPKRPNFRGAERYKPLQQDQTQEFIEPHNTTSNREKLFTVTITATKQMIGGYMNYNSKNNQCAATNQQATAEQQFLVDLIFKPNENGLKLRTEETQLLLAYIGEILKEVEEEEKQISSETVMQENGAHDG